jgi:uncharacterized membrane protein HdeD (DUF308 family)
MRPSAFIGVVCLLFGILIFIFPDLLSYLVATFLIIIGALAIIGSPTFRRW